MEMSSDCNENNEINGNNKFKDKSMKEYEDIVKSKFICVNECDEYFLDFFFYVFEDHYNKYEKNKNLYFELNSKKNFKHIIWVSIQLIIYLLSRKIFSDIIDSFIIFIFSILYLIIYFKQYNKKRELLFRKYGETWVRHSIAFSLYKGEIIKFISGIDVYSECDDINKKQIFKKRIMDIYYTNIDNFKENMKKIEEYIE